MIPIEQDFAEIEIAQTLTSKINDSFQTLQSQFSQWRNLDSFLSNLKSSLKFRASELDSREKNLNTLQKSLDDRLKQLELKEKHLESSQILLDDRRKEVELRENELNCKEMRFVCDRCKTLGFKVSDIGNVVVKFENSSDFIETFEDGCIPLSMKIDGKTLQMFLNDRFKEHELIGEEVYYGLKLSSDPAKLVLDAMQGFLPSHLEREGVDYSESVVRSSCVLLLEQLMKLKPEIKKAVREEAMGLANEWRDRIKDKTGTSYMVVLGFLLVVVVYGLEDGFIREELRRLCDVIHQHKLVGELRSKLGFLRLRVCVRQKCEVSRKSPKAEKELPHNINDDDDRSKYGCSSKKNIHNNHKYQHQPAVWNSSFPKHVKYQMNTDSPQNYQDQFTVGNSSFPKHVNYQMNTDSPQNYQHKPAVWKPSFPNHVKFQKFTDPPQNDQDQPAVWNSSFPKHLKFQMNTDSPQFGLSESKFTVDQKTKPHTMDKINAVDRPFDLRSVCRNMDADGLKSYLIEHVNELDSFHVKLSDSLRCALDPAKLVLIVVRGLYQEANEILGDAYQSCCNLLLDVLMIISPEVTFSVQEESIIFASLWKARLAIDGNKPLHVFGFLKFLAAYILASSFEANELLSLFCTFYNGVDIYEREQNPILCRALGLEVKIPDLIQSLIQENRRLEAIRYICTFNLADKFPPVPLLKEHLDYTTVTAMEGCKDLGNSIKAQNKCADSQIVALQGVIRCIFDFKLEFESSPILLQQRVRQLEREKEERSSSRQATCSPLSESQQLEQQSPGKRSRIDSESDDEGSPTHSVEMVSNMACINFPSPVYSPQSVTDIPPLPRCDFLFPT